MLTRRATQWLVLTVLAGALWSTGGCAEEPLLSRPTPTVSPSLSPSPVLERDDPSRTAPATKQVSESNYYRVLADILYDSDKVVGLFPTFLGSGPNSYIEYQFPGEPVVRVESQARFGGSTELPIGTPFAFHCYSDWFGHLRGFERVRANPSPVYFVIPVSASALGVEPLVQNYTSTPPGGHGLGIGTDLDQFIADSNTQPSAAVSVQSLPGIDNLTPSVHVEYPEGNASHLSVGDETLVFPKGLFAGGGGWVITWGYEGSSAPWLVRIPSHLPAGPAHLTHSLDGYVDDYASVELTDLKARRWTPLLGASFDTPGYPTPSEAAGIATLTAEEGDFILEPAIREKLLGQCELFTNLKHASDRNGDKVLDIADYLKLSLERGGSR